MEEYKPFIEDYEISNLGNVRRKMKKGNYKNITGSIMNRGYRYIQLQRNGKRINHLVHQMVAEKFIGIRPEGLVIDHIDRNKLNNNVSNLRYVTQKVNCYNRDNIIIDIPIDVEDRKIKVIERYNRLNRDKILQNKKEYYKNNRDQILQKDKEKRESSKVKIICETCNKEYEIQSNSIKYKKGKNCKICNSLEQLKLINK
jgi:hypothetical protein